MINKLSQNKPKVLIGNNQLVITVNPFDNFFKFTLSKIQNDEIIRYNLNDFTDLKMTIKGAKKDLDFTVFRESSDNDFENGILVFKLSESSNGELQRLAKNNFNLFYINGVDVFGNRQIIYSGFYKMWDSKKNIEKLEQEYSQENTQASSVVSQNQANSQEQDNVNSSINDAVNSNTTTNTSNTPVSEQIENSSIDISNFKPRYRSSDLAISIGIAPSVNDKIDYKPLSPIEKGQLENNFKNANFWVSTETSSTSYTNSELAQLYPGSNTTVAFDKNLFIDYVEAYFKGLDIFPNTTVYDNWFRTTVLKNDLINYIKTKPFRTSQIITGEYLPLTDEHRAYFRQVNIPQFMNDSKPKDRSESMQTRSESTTLQTRSESMQTRSESTTPQTRGITQTTNSAESQAPEVRIIGIISDNDTSVKIQGAQVTIKSLANIFSEKTISTTSNGTFDFGPISDFPSDCKFIVQKTGYLRKEIDLNELEINDEIKTGGIRIKIINQN